MSNEPETDSAPEQEMERKTLVRLVHELSGLDLGPEDLERLLARLRAVEEAVLDLESLVDARVEPFTTASLEETP